MSDDNMDRILETAHARLGLSQASQIWMDDVHLLAAVEALKKALGNDDDLLLDRLNAGLANNDVPYRVTRQTED